jgi:hypothetical protein
MRLRRKINLKLLCRRIINLLLLKRKVLRKKNLSLKRKPEMTLESYLY